MRVVGAVGAVVAGAALLVALATGGSASAAQDPGWGLRWGDQPVAADLAPGSHASASVVVTNDRAAPLEARLEVVDLVDDEGGCSDRERRSPREDCGASGELGRGELSEQLVVTVTHRGEVIHHGALAGWAATPTAPVVVPAGTEAVVDLRLALPESSTNETMTDRVGFGLRASAQEQGADGSLGESGVLGSQLDAAGLASPAEDDGRPAPGIDGLLPATGTTVGLLMVLVGLGLAGLGGTLWRLGRRGRHQA